MTNRLAIALGLALVGFLIADWLLDLGWALFLAQRFVDLVRWVAFWR